MRRLPCPASGLRTPYSAAQAGMNSIEKPSDLKKFGFSGPKIVQLLNTVDMIGISNYPEVGGGGAANAY
jgi:hypothetical protein